MRKIKPRPLSDADYQLLADFRLAMRGFFAFSKDAVFESGLAPQQYQALLVLRARREREVTIGDLAEELYIRHHTCVELVKRLERADLVTRRGSQRDGRRVLLEMSPKSESLLAGLAEVHLAELSRFAPILSQLQTAKGS